MANAVNMEGVYFKLKDHYILEDVNLTIKKNDFMALIGPNGGGKTTLLKLILGLLNPDKGNIEVLGMAPGKSKNIGYLPQKSSYQSNFPISVLEVVLMGRYKQLLKGYNKEDRRSALDSLKKVEMLHLKNEQIEKLSGGQLQRVFIARALSRNPELLLLDEPTASIDPHFQGKFYEILSKLRKKMAVVMVSHDIGVVSSYVDSIACLNQKIYCHGPVEESIEGLEKAYKCPIDLIAHGFPHRVLREHE
ncbi:MAG: ABC transporter [Methanobacterium sp.]|nr:MAG: ABC transporter [Methanobacterium sp.]